MCRVRRLHPLAWYRTNHTFPWLRMWTVSCASPSLGGVLRYHDNGVSAQVDHLRQRLAEALRQAASAQGGSPRRTRALSSAPATTTSQSSSPARTEQQHRRDVHHTAGRAEPADPMAGEDTGAQPLQALLSQSAHAATAAEVAPLTPQHPSKARRSQQLTPLPPRHHRPRSHLQHSEAPDILQAVSTQVCAPIVLERTPSSGSHDRRRMQLSASGAHSRSAASPSIAGAGAVRKARTYEAR
eukprot:m.457353 g.457353  ORF g.457353 m.457353 type:complete len:241 (-) comp21578_c0_seq2:398-1120(-)